MRTLYLIDGHWLIFRSYYAPLGTLSSPSGEPTKATYLFTQNIVNLLRDERPDYFAVILDFDDKSTERKKIFAEYKANRERAPEDFSPQVDRILEILDLMGVSTYMVQGHEADDLIATIASRLAGEEIEIRVISKDKDLHQILSNQVVLWDPSGKGLVLDEKALLEEKGYTPQQAVEIQTLTGDSVDNVPGIPGIGPKKALGLIKTYGSAAGVIENVDELTPKMRENVIEYADSLDLTRRLVTLKRDVDFDFDLERCKTGEIPAAKLRPLFEELGFRRLVDRLDSTPAADGTATAKVTSNGDRTIGGTYRLINSETSFRELLGELREQKRFAIDTETTSLHIRDCDLVGISVSWKAGEGAYIALRSKTGKTLEVEPTLEALRPILEDPKIEKVGQNIKYDLSVLRGAGIDLQGVVFDTMVASYLVQPGRRSHGMDALSRDLLGHEPIPITELIGKGKKQLSMLDVDLARLSEYAAEDADITWRLYEKLAPKMEESAARALFHDIEMPLVDVLADMEFEGVALDCDVLATIAKRLGDRVEELKKEIHREAGHEFNVDSPKQLAGVLFDKIGLRVVKKTKTSRSTDASVLATLVHETASPLPGLVLQYRELAKLLGTYVEPLPGLISARTNRLHASFHQTVTTTGRLSSSDPNLQNIPVRTEQGREIRKAFIPGSPDRVLIAADYSQIELRILAHLSADPGLVEAFTTDQDIHAFVASQINGVPPDEVTREMRTQAKAVNFGIIYGQGAFGLARTLGITRSAATKFIDEYRERYPGTVHFTAKCVEEALEKDGVTTMLGRYRPIPEIHSSNRGIQAQGERLAVNTVVQGSAADMIKAAMVHLRRRVRDKDLDLRLLIQVHDELVFEAPREKAREYAEIVRHEMENALPLDVPVKVHVGRGNNWLEGK